MPLFHLTLLLCIAICNTSYQEQEPALVAEKVYLHTDRDYYYPGDDIWFKAYVIDAAYNKPSPVKSNLHVELISPNSEIIQSRTIRIENGIGNGDFHLADSLLSGNYRIRAYTNFMRNFDDSFFFNKDIVVISLTDEGNEIADSVEYIKNNIDISFFPEGGSLVDEVTSQVAFKAVDALGKGCFVTGKILSTSGDLITDFQSNELGVGVFNLKPVTGTSYYAHIQNRVREEFRADLPKSFATGIAMKTLITQDKNLILKVFTNDETLPSAINKELICSFSSRNLVTKMTRVKISSLANNYLLPLDDFPDGILRVTLSEVGGLPLCERLIYLQKNRDVKVIVSSDKEQYSPRERATLNVSVSGDTLNLKAFLSLAVVESGFLHDSLLYPRSIASWFLLESDVHGKVENPSWYFDITNKDRFKDLDLLLLTQGWRDFQWKYDSSGFFQNDFGFTISGKLRKIVGNKPVPNGKISMGIFGNRSYSFLTTETDSAGKYQVEGLDFTGNSKLIVTALDDKDKSAGWIFVDSSFYVPADVPVLETESQTRLKYLMPVKYSELKQEAIIKVAKQKLYKLSDTLNIGEVTIVGKRPDTPQEVKVKMSRSRYGTPDKELIITEKLGRFPNILRAINGRIPGVWIDDNFNPKFSTITFRGEPMILLRDGIPTDMLDIATIPVSMIDRVDMLHWSPSFMKVTDRGVIGGQGVLNIITKSGGENREPKPLFYSSTLNRDGFNAPRIFYSPKHDSSSKDAFLPDNRYTIYWEPNITIDGKKNATLEYFNADSPTPISVMIEGITEDGIPIAVKTYYDVID